VVFGETMKFVCTDADLNLIRSLSRHGLRKTAKRQGCDIHEIHRKTKSLARRLNAAGHNGDMLLQYLADRPPPRTILFSEIQNLRDSDRDVIRDEDCVKSNVDIGVFLN
jgi:hypothetical protein